MVEALKSIGSLAGIAALMWRLFDEYRAFLRLAVSTEPAPPKWMMITTEIDNRGLRAKRITAALVLVGPENESPIDTVNSLLEHADRSTVGSTNDFVTIAENIVHADRAVLMIPFYYSENVHIADETLSYTLPLNVEALPIGEPYAVRFLIFGEHRLHRSTQSCFVRPSNEQRALPTLA
jgi:hypothetical protein